jgi:amino acid adenylation domain-containing protein
MLPGKLLHEIFEARVRLAPERIAVSTLDENISYGDLNLRANQLAHKLQALGTGIDVLVGLCVDRSLEMIIGLLAILKSGGAYVPIDPSYPSQRIHLLLNDSAVNVVLTVSRVAECLDGCTAEIVCIDEIHNNTSQPLSQPEISFLTKGNDNSLAYVIYTSGSTGTPKGVLVEHQSVIRLFEQTNPWFNFNEQDVWTLFHSIGFDFSVWEIWGALLYGGHLVIVPFDVTRSPNKFYSLLIDKGITILNQTPSAFRHLIAADISGGKSAELSLRLVIFGGEALELKLLEPWIAYHGDQHPELVNMYGITETTVHATYRRITKKDLGSPDFSPIGIPIPDLQIYLLDELGQSVPDGTPGDIYIAGPGVARGYLNRPELTKERFLPNPYSSAKEARLYYSGDRAIRISNGELVYLGRADEQVKVRGFRIEPREVELCLCGYSQVMSTVVIPQDYGDGDVRLTAYVVPRPDIDITTQLIEELTNNLAKLAKAELPIHMRPSAFVILPVLPITPHGKLDRSALAQSIANHSISNEEATTSKTFTEQIVTKIWEDILEIRGIGVNDDFFAIGGTSLALIRIFGRINEHFNVSTDVSAVLEGATISRLANSIDDELRNQQHLLQKSQ